MQSSQLITVMRLENRLNNLMTLANPIRKTKMKKYFINGLMVLLVGITSSSNAAVCLISGGTQLPSGTLFALGPNLAGYVASIPEVGTALINAIAPWNATDAVGRIAGGNGVVTSSDCPNTAYHMIGAYSFSSTSVPCYNQALVGSNGYAYNSIGSMAINTDMAWSVNGAPAPGQFDLQSTVTHEFGHILGLHHQQLGVCGTPATGISCITYGDTKETMSYGPSGELCRRTLAPNDLQSINFFY